MLGHVFTQWRKEAKRKRKKQTYRRSTALRSQALKGAGQIEGAWEERNSFPGSLSVLQFQVQLFQKLMQIPLCLGSARLSCCLTINFSFCCCCCYGQFGGFQLFVSKRFLTQAIRQWFSKCMDIKGGKVCLCVCVWGGGLIRRMGLTCIHN